MRPILTLCAVALASALALPAPAQTSDYIVVGGDNGDAPGPGVPAFLAINGGVIDRQWSPAPGTDTYQYGIAVLGTIRTFARDIGASGAEYDLNGVDQGPRYAHPAGIPADCFDGTTDGVHHYTIDINGTVWRCDLDWSDPVALFTIPSGDIGTITFDRTFGTLWIGRWSAPFVEQYQTDGTPVSSFNTGHPFNVALAMDPVDGTLWLHDRTEQGTYEQWTRAGVLLQRIKIPGADAYNAIGGEFPFPPCPADLTADGTLNLDDLDAFADAFLAGLALADINRDGTLNLDDIDAYVTSFLAGCD